MLVEPHQPSSPSDRYNLCSEIGNSDFLIYAKNLKKQRFLIKNLIISLNTLQYQDFKNFGINFVVNKLTSFHIFN